MVFAPAVAKAFVVSRPMPLAVSFNQHEPELYSIHRRHTSASDQDRLALHAELRAGGSNGRVGLGVESRSWSRKSSKRHCCGLIWSCFRAGKWFGAVVEKMGKYWVVDWYCWCEWISLYRDISTYLSSTTLTRPLNRYGHISMTMSSALEIIANISQLAADLRRSSRAVSSGAHGPRTSCMQSSTNMHGSRTSHTQSFGLGRAEVIG